MILALSVGDLSLWWAGFIAMDCVEAKPCGRRRKMFTVWQPEKKKRGERRGCGGSSLCRNKTCPSKALLQWPVSSHKTPPPPSRSIWQ